MTYDVSLYDEYYKLIDKIYVLYLLGFNFCLGVWCWHKQYWLNYQLLIYYDVSDE